MLNPITNPTIFISLGGDCEVAFNIREFTGNDVAYFFDWLMTPVNVISHLIETEFSLFFQPTYLKKIGENAYRDTLYNIDILHDLHDDHYDYNYTKNKYNFLGQRFLETIASFHGTIVFVKKHHYLLDGNIDLSEIHLLTDFLKKKCDCYLLFVHSEETLILEEQLNFICMYHPINLNYDWRGDQSQWAKSLKYALTLATDQASLIEQKDAFLELKNYYELLPSPPHNHPYFSTWQQLSAWTKSIRKSPEFILGDVSGDVLKYFFNETGIPESGIFALQNVRVTDAGIIIKDGRFVACNYIGHSINWCQRRIAEKNIQISRFYNASKIGIAILLFCGGYDIYGHWLVDIIPKLYLLQRLNIDIRQITILTPNDLPEFGYTFLEFFGINHGNLHIYDPHSDPVYVEDLIVPTLLRGGDRPTKLFSESIKYAMGLIDRSLQSVSNKPQEKLYISRKLSGRGSRILTNSLEIEDIADKHGYSIVHPEQMSLSDQINLFRDAKVVIGEYGSALHNTIFSRENTVVCSLRGNQVHPAFLQSGICEAFNQKDCYVFGPATGDRINYNFRIDESTFKQALDLIDLIK